MQIDYEARLQKLRESVTADVIAIVPGSNMVYFTGLHLHLMERPTIALVSHDGLTMIMPQLEMMKLDARPDLGAQAFLWRDADGYDDAFHAAISALGLDKSAKLAVDGMTMRVFEWLALQRNGAKIEAALDAGQDLLNLRTHKSDAEITFIQQAVDLSEEALKRTIEWVEIGMTERQIAQKLRDELNILGADGVSFDPLVLVGENSANPHGHPGDRILGDQDFLLIDFGGQKHGYPADITRTFCLGTPTEQMREIYEAVLKANQAAQALAKPGITCHELDQAARVVIAEAGYGADFQHRLGHGLGLDVHELPNIAENNHVPLEEGMVFTIEPGIYVTGVGGVRIEDNVVVTADGIRSLTTFPRAL